MDFLVDGSTCNRSANGLLKHADTANWLVGKRGALNWTLQVIQSIAVTGKPDNQIIKHINSMRNLGEAEDHGLRLRGADSHSHTAPDLRG